LPLLKFQPSYIAGSMCFSSLADLPLKPEGLQTVLRGAAGYQRRFSGVAQAHTPYFENCKYIFDKFNLIFYLPASLLT